jgi:hypothetical protein
MVNWPEIQRRAEYWANGFLAEAAAASLRAIAVTALVLVGRVS